MIKNKLLKVLIILSLLAPAGGFAANDELNDLELIEAEDVQILNDTSSDLDMSDVEEIDDLESLKNDIGEEVFPEEKNDTEIVKESYFIKDDVEILVDDEKLLEGDDKKTAKKKPVIFDVGAEEKKLIEMSKFLESKIADAEWDEISSGSKQETYTVQEGDWLWKISQQLFGTGFYYSKIWSMNPHITNPHEIEPGMVLVFNTGSSDEFPNVEVGSFAPQEIEGGDKTKIGSKTSVRLPIDSFAENATPNWLEEREKLISQGAFFQYASEETYEDLNRLGAYSLRSEYQKYEPPLPDILIREPGEEYDDTGFDKNSKIVFDIKEGFFLNTFVTTNVIQDLGFIEAKQDESVLVKKHERIYVNFDDGVKVKPGDMFSVYLTEGKVTHSISDRAGFRYTVAAQLKVIRKQNDLWEAEVVEQTGVIERGARVTVYTPKIAKILKTFNRRNIEAAVMDFYKDTASVALGDVVYLDRGRADGVELGNVFEAFSFRDRGTNKRISPDPTYKIGEMTVITVTDDFSTALITNSSNEISKGALVLAKTEEQVLREEKLKRKDIYKDVKDMQKKSLDELDVELNLDSMGEDLLDKIDQVQLSEDELEELERQEREKSVIKENERDLKELERLENEIIDAESSLNEAKVDEDKFLEQQNLDEIEKNKKKQNPNAFESMNDIEKDVGRKFLDQDLNSKENPYGLTEYDLEEIDELLNTD